MNLIEFKLKNTSTDYSIYTKYFLHEKNPLFKNYIFIVVLGLSVYFGIQNEIFNILTIDDYKFPESLIDNNKVLAIVYFCLLFTAVLFLFRYLIFRGSKKRIEMLTYLANEKKFTLTENEIIIDRGGIEIKVKYSAIYNCKIMDKYCYLYIDPEAPYIIPNTIKNYNNLLEILSEKTNFRL